jgi:hypothetical protein
MIEGGDHMPMIPPEKIEKAREIDLLTYLKNYEPFELVKLSDREYCTREHDSLKISNGKWHWFSHDVGGVSALDYLIKVRGLSFPKAVETVLGQEQVKTPSFYASKHQEKPTKLLLPERNSDNKRAIEYLENRGIERALTDVCIDKGFIYESKPYHNCVFVGFDNDGEPRYASYRSTNGSAVKGEAAGSDKRYSFRIKHDSNTVHVFESAIDLLSFMTLVRMETGKWIKESLISLGGVYFPNRKIEDSKVPSALNNVLENDRSICKIVLHLDKDNAGRASTKAISVMLGTKYLVYDEPPKFGKDVNDELMIRLGILV